MKGEILEGAPQKLSAAILGKQFVFTRVNYNLSAEILTRRMLQRNEVVLNNKGVPVCRTGKFTGRAPTDRFIVDDTRTHKSVDWGNINFAYPADAFDSLADRLANTLMGKEVFVRDVYACAQPSYRLRVRLISSVAYHSLFVRNMFIPVPQEELKGFEPDWTILADPHFKARPETEKTNSENFVILNMDKKVVCVGGTGYTGELKKSIFSVLNYLLPVKHNILTMHCSANITKGGGTALFFGLSGTGKTTLSSDPERPLVGDDEHGWDDEGVFNLEGGCYAKVINLSEEKEPLIWNAIKPYALLENTVQNPKTGETDYADRSITENTRVSYPLSHISGAFEDSRAPHPSDVFFLSCDAFGILPPLALLNAEQAAFYFLCGYTAKIAGTEQGITEPVIAFSPCFGAPFLPLPHRVYAEMFKKKIARHKTRVWLVNTGWIRGPYGRGERISLAWTRTLLHAALEGRLSAENMKKHAILDIAVPVSCPGVPDEILSPNGSWEDAAAYAIKARELKQSFAKQINGQPTLT